MFRACPLARIPQSFMYTREGDSSRGGILVRGGGEEFSQKRRTVKGYSDLKKKWVGG